MTYVILIAITIALIAIFNKSKKEVSQETAIAPPIKIDMHVSPLPSEKDHWEGSFWDVTDPRTVHAKLRFGYTDGAGKQTERRVAVSRFGGLGPDTLVIGRCHTRNATRTFRADRIESCIDEETGEVIEDVRLYLQEKYDASPEKTKEILFNSEFDVLRIMLFIGKADGQLRAAEKTVIRNACVAITNDNRLTDEMIDDMFSGMGVPSIQAFRLAVGRLAKRDPATQAILVSAAEKIIATQKTIHPAEQEALDYMRKRFAGALTGEP